MSIPETAVTTKETMSIQEKKSVVNLVSSVLIFGIYGWYVLQNYQAGGPALAYDFKFWASAILILIPISIVAQIIVAIVFAIVNAIATNEREDPSFQDERDKLIELKAARNSMYVFILGFVLAMVSVVMGYSPAVMFIILAVSGLASEIADELSQLYFYRRGV